MRKKKPTYEELEKQIIGLKVSNDNYRKQQELFTSALNSIAEIIVIKGNPEDLLEDVNRVLGETLQLDRALIYYVSYEQNQVVALCEWLKTTDSRISATKGTYSLDLFKSSYIHAKKTQKYIESHYFDINENFITDGADKILHEYMNIKSLLWYPFDFDDNNLYLFALNQVLEPRKWTQDEIRFIESVAKQVSLALMKIKLNRERNLVKESEEKLIHLNADKDRFITILSHDLKSPFNTILGFLSLLLTNIHKYDIEKIEKQLNIINNTAQNTFELLEDILLWARAQSGKIPFKPRKVDFREIYAAVTKSLINQANKKGIAINCFEHEKTVLMADVDMVKTILRNLISNAIKFSNEKGQISIYTENNPSDITITVSDNGTGIDKDNQSKLWELSQLYTTTGTANEKGTGLGLLLCKEFIEKHGGKIWVESEPGKGSDFKFTLPITKE